jgi:NADH dehydrogenase
MARFSPVLPIMGDGQAKMQPVAVVDVAACFVACLLEPKSIGQTYDLCGPEALSFNEIIDAILQTTGRRRWKLHLPMSLARMQAAVLEFIFPLFGKAPPLSRDQLLMLEEDNVGNPPSAEQLFRGRATSFRDGIASYLEAE